jgi:translation initiation factor 4E
MSDDVKTEDVNEECEDAPEEGEGGEPESEGRVSKFLKLELPVREGHHRLESAWTLWYDTKGKSKTQSAGDWQSGLVDLGSFNTIEGFWSIYSHIVRPSKVPKDSNYWLFRDHITPMWETFPTGGCWILKVRKKIPGLLDRMWEELMLGALGEAFEEPDVVGVVVSIRKAEDRLSVWHADDTEPRVRNKIGEHLKSILTHGVGHTVEYKSNASSMKDGSTFRNTKTYQFVVTQNKTKGKHADEEAAAAPAAEEAPTDA